MRSRTTALGLAVLLLLSVASCDEQSRVDPDATLTISGSLRAADGGPLADRPVRLGAGVSVGDGTLGLLTLGLACASGVCSGHIKDARTDSAGHYSFTLKGRDTQSSFGEARSELLTGTAPPAESEVSGASVSAAFKVQTEKLVLPPLTLVDPGLAVDGRTQVVAARWSTPRSGPYSLSFESDDAVAVWQSSTSGSRQGIDGRLLEDTAGRVVVSGQAKDQLVGSDLDITWRSPGTGYAAADGPPPSRGRTCSYEVAGRAAVQQERCPFTDGDLSAQVVPHVPCPTTTSTAAPPCDGARAVTVDLGATLPVELVVVRGCARGCAVDLSADGKRFVPIGSVSDEYGVARAARTRARWVRVSIGSQGLREVSVWGPAPRGPALLSLDDEKRAELSKPYDTQRHNGHKAPGTMLIVLAAILVAAGVLAIGFVLGRRRR